MDLRVATDLSDVVVDVGRLELLLTNLLSNAIKYSDPAKRNRFVDVSLERITESTCVFHVADNGIGMNRDQLQKLFTPLLSRTRAPRCRARCRRARTRLGIVREVAQAIGVGIGVDSAAGVGTPFTVTLPLRPARSTPPS